MHALRLAIVVVWILFWVYWFAVGTRAKHGSFGSRRIPLNGVTAIAVLVLVRLFRRGSLEIQSPVLGAACCWPFWAPHSRRTWSVWQ